MAVPDSLLQVSANQQITADAVSTNTIDNGNVTPKRALGEGEPMGYLMAIKAIGTNSGSTLLQAIQSAAANLSSPEIIGQLALATAQIVAGALYVIPISYGNAALRYYGMNHDITGVVDYTVDAFFGPLIMLPTKSRAYAKGYSIQ